MSLEFTSSTCYESVKVLKLARMTLPQIWLLQVGYALATETGDGPVDSHIFGWRLSAYYVHEWGWRFRGIWKSKVGGAVLSWVLRLKPSHDSTKVRLCAVASEVIKWWGWWGRLGIQDQPNPANFKKKYFVPGWGKLGMVFTWVRGKSL